MKCDICYIDMYEAKNTCCGFNVCAKCNFKSYGACYVHEREKINREVQCNDCGEIATAITSGICEYCDKKLCLKCISVDGFGLHICYDVKCLEKAFIEMCSSLHWGCNDCTRDDCCSNHQVDKKDFIRLHSK
ncbi:hypothetical protein PGAG_00317 [Phaeocystis globosa virus 12T]|uniref:Uncharacterized protein n=1 Tax=Phaeocystis globosa virus PgV-16T TaxID=3071227 RepID=A0AC59EXG1_9VIRU|nr:hypothetical protein PGCG_00356 [Phaeocystis globosa virus]AET73206.1 hypothetical protein PGAG_00317 [Phaeocystis globosa virus 12T]AET74030.1 hypothetical protein PGBG_00322 [Phaeocystis globosa virus 14T]AGM15667.1 hypothetical protein PGCG_00356 [Phaeocystis globosa virus PgV-16T]UYE94397.1 hypothetical protein PGV14T_00356 [Phaeocystis globosa virus]